MAVAGPKVAGSFHQVWESMGSEEQADGLLHWHVHSWRWRPFGYLLLGGSGLGDGGGGTDGITRVGLGKGGVFGDGIEGRGGCGLGLGGG